MESINAKPKKSTIFQLFPGQELPDAVTWQIISYL